MRHKTRALLMLVVGIVLFAGLPICGWGLGDVAGFIGHPARLSYLLLVLLLNVIVVITKSESKKTSRRPIRTIARQRVAVGLLQIISILIVVAGPFCDRREIAVAQAPAIRYLGLFLFAVGFLALHWAEVALGKQFSVQVAIQDGHKLVTNGPYRYLRHPRYVALAVFSAGISLVFRSWLALALVAALVGILLWRIRDEEALLRDEFGPAWADYVSRSWRLIPFVY